MPVAYFVSPVSSARVSFHFISSLVLSSSHTFFIRSLRLYFGNIDLKVQLTYANFVGHLVSGRFMLVPQITEVFVQFYLVQIFIYFLPRPIPVLNLPPTRLIWSSPVSYAHAYIVFTGGSVVRNDQYPQISDTIKRHEVDAVLTNQNSIIGASKDLKWVSVRYRKCSVTWGYLKRH